MPVPNLGVRQHVFDGVGILKGENPVVLGIRGGADGRDDVGARGVPGAGSAGSADRQRRQAPLI